MIGSTEKSGLKARWYDSDLPTLTESDTERSLSYHCKSWAFNFIDPSNLGKYIHLEDLGVSVQNVGDYRARCIWAIDHFESRIALAMLKNTFESINVTFELGEYTVVVPYIEPNEDAEAVEKQPEQFGMEVV